MKYKIISMILFCVSMVQAADRYEAEDAIIDENSIQKVADASASGGMYIMAPLFNYNRENAFCQIACMV